MERDKLTPCKGCKYYKLNYKEVLLYWTPGYFCMLKGRKIDENDRDCEEYEANETSYESENDIEELDTDTIV